VAQLLSHSSRWTKGAAARTKPNGHALQSWELAEGKCFCLFGALKRVYGRYNGKWQIAAEKGERCAIETFRYP